MSQKTILSFFKQAVAPAPDKNDSSKVPKKSEKVESTRNKDNDDSPIKLQKKRKRIKQMIDSDDESDSSVENQKKVKLENGHVKNGEDLSASISCEAEKADVMDVESSSNVTDNTNALPEFIPKRKTARKQIRGGQKLKEVSLSTKYVSASSKMDENPADDTSEKPKETENHMTESQNLKPDSDSETESKIKDAKLNSSKDGKSNSSENVKPSTPEDVKPSTSEDVKPSTSEDVKPSTSEDVKPSTSEDVKPSTSEDAEPSASEDAEPSPSEDADPSASEDVKTSLLVKIKPSSSEKKSPKTSSRAKSKTPVAKKKQAMHPFFAPKKEEKEEIVTNEGAPKKSSSKDTQSSTQNGTVYDPSKNKYHPIEDACWKHNEKVPYLALAKTLELIENTSARLKMIEILANFLRSIIVLTPDDLLSAIYLCLNRLAPEYEGIELGIGDMLLMKAVAQATGRTVEKIKAEVAIKGDLGLVAESSRGNQRIMFAPPKLTVSSVFSKFKEIAKMSGNAAMSKKTDKIQALFVACRDCEAKYIIRSLSGKLRIGLAEQSVLAALGRAAVLTPPNQSYPPEIIDKSSKMSADSFKEHLSAQTLILKTTYCECPNFDRVIPVLLKEGIDCLPERCQLLPGCPLKPMLAHPTNGIDEVLNRFDKNEFTCEFKYDGERAQIHFTENGDVKIFSRNQEDNTSKYPDVIARISETLKETTKSFILDSEVVAWDCKAKQILPFQVLSTRKKKDAVESDIVVQVCIMAFDLLFINGESLVKKPLKERRALLHSSFVEIPDKFVFVSYRDGNSAETMQEYLDESIKGNCEGLMVKALTVDASYEIAKRSHNWLKLKKDYLKGVGDTLDLVVIGGYHGKGKRTGTYGGFLLACYDEDNEEFQSICKLGTGFSEEELDTHTNFLKQHVIKEPKSYYRYDSSLEPDEWFEPVQIWEIKCADLSISPVHKAALGIVDPEKGISLRFPRFLRIREDKTKPEDCTVATQIAEMYQKQDQVQNMSNKNVKTEDY